MCVLQVLAQGDPSQYRAFLYAKRASDGLPVMVLYETAFQGAAPTMTVTIRSADATAADDMKMHWEQCVRSFV